MKTPKSEGSDPQITPKKSCKKRKTRDAPDEEGSLTYVKHSQDEVIAAFDQGEITGAGGGPNGSVEDLVAHFLRNGFLRSALNKFPDPRKNWEVPMDILLLPQILQRLNGDHSLLLAPYLLNSPAIITELGYNVRMSRAIA